jgi:hypothetical protein
MLGVEWGGTGMRGARTGQPAEDGGTLDKFLTPEAMLTPGAAGGITMLIANALANNFGFTPSYIGLALSFLFGLLVMASVRKWWIRTTYYVLNSLVIFCVAFGSGNLVASKSAKARGETSLSLISPAYAQDNGVASNSDAVRNLVALRDDYAKLDARYKKEAEALSALQKNGAPQEDIDKQIALIQDLQNQKATNLQLQEKTLSEIAVRVSPNGEVAKGINDAARDLSRGPGPNNEIRRSNSFFRPWDNPFRF